MRTDDHFNTIIDNLSRLIAHALRSMNQELAFPGTDPDRTDAYIDAIRERVSVLREIRANVEDEMTKALP